MTCGGCSGAVTRALEKAQGNGSERHMLLSLTITHFKPVSSYDVSLEKQEVLVKGTIPYDDVLAVIKKTGKEVSINAPLKSPLDIIYFRFAPGRFCPRKSHRIMLSPLKLSTSRR
jgi:copper chaperone